MTQPLVTPARYSQGVTTSIGDKNVLWHEYAWPIPVDLVEYKNDFLTYAAGDWTVTSTNSGTTALAAGNGGLLLQTTGSTTTNYQANELVSTPFYFTSADRHWFWYNFQLSDTAHTLMLAGLVDTLSGPMTPGQGVYFSKTDASTTLNLILNKGGTTTTITVGTIAAATAYTVGWYYDGRTTPTLRVYSSIGQTLPINKQGTWQVQGGLQVTSAGVNAPSGVLLTNLPAVTTGLKIGFGITTGASAAHTNTVDYVGAASTYTRF